METILKRFWVVLIICALFIVIPSKYSSSEGICNFVNSDSACQNAPVGSPCAKGDVEGVCAPSYRFGNTIGCKCVYGKPAKVKKCKDGLRWSPVKQKCMKVMGSSPDGSVQCIPPYYWDQDDKNCEILF